MDKLVAGPAARGALDLDDPPELTVAKVAETLLLRPHDLRVVILDKPRHARLIDRVRATGATVTTPRQGDVGGALMALLPDGGADLLMGVGGSPEGVMTACAARALGGEMRARPAPQRPAEAEALRAAGVDRDVQLTLGDLAGRRACFAATGVTDGPLLAGVRVRPQSVETQSLLVVAGTVRRHQERTRRFVPGRQATPLSGALTGRPVAIGEV